MNKELIPKELSEAYLRQFRGEDSASAAESFDAVDIWEDLMCDEPEKAWPVFAAGSSATEQAFGRG